MFASWMAENGLISEVPPTEDAAHERAAAGRPETRTRPRGRVGARRQRRALGDAALPQPDQREACRRAPRKGA